MDYQEFLRNPSRLEAWAGANARPQRPLTVDEVQRLPELLNEVHRLITDLTPGATYAFQARAVYKENYTNWTDSVIWLCS